MVQEVVPLVASVDIVTGADGQHWPAHTHQSHELLSAVTRRVSVTTPDAVFIAPPGASVWIPAGVVHDVRAAGGNRMRCTWFSPDTSNALTDRVVVTTVPPLLDDVLAHIESIDDEAERRRAEAFAIDLLARSNDNDHALPTPRTPWLRTVTDALIANPADRRTVEDWAAAASVSVRTLMRRFQVETGMSLSNWRSALRVRIAMSTLAAGTDVTHTARVVGFESVAAFSAAFRRDTGTTPGDFARSHGAVTDLR